jgi:inner membrane protein involved in colicin E2 resistance
MHVCFVAAGFFSFQLLFAYLTDVIPLYVAFGISALVSVALVCGYLRAVGGDRLLRIALPAQVGYMVLFSVSFFFDGMTGLTIAIGSVITLGLLMKVTAKTSWKEVFAPQKRPAPPVLPSL